MSQETSKPAPAKRQLTGLHGLRAIAAIGIVFYHLNQHRTTAGLADWNWNLYKLTELLPFIVSFFFVLGGALHSMGFWKIIFTRSPENPEKNIHETSSEIAVVQIPSIKSALIDRFFRIAPAYYAALLFTFGIVWILQGVSGSDFVRLFAGLSFLSWVHPLTFFPVEMNGPLWFISYDIMGGLFILALMHVLVRIPNTSKRVYKIIGVYLGVLTLLLVGYFAFTQIEFPQLPGIVSEWFPWYNPFIFGIHFMIGTIVWALWSWWDIKLWQKAFWCDVLWILGLIGFAAFLWYIRFSDILSLSYPKSPYHFPFSTLLIAVILLITPYTRWVGNMLDNTITKYIAKISYSLYLWHALVIVLLCRWIFGNNALEIGEWWMLTGWVFLFAGILAILSEKYIERSALSIKKRYFDKV